MYLPTKQFVSRGKQGGKTTELIAARNPEMYYVTTKHVVLEFRNADLAWTTFNSFNSNDGPVKLVYNGVTIAER